MEIGLAQCAVYAKPLRQTYFQSVQDCLGTGDGIHIRIFQQYTQPRGARPFLACAHPAPEKGAAHGCNRVWTIKGHTAVYTYAAQLISQSQTDLYLVLTDDALQTLQPDIAAAQTRGVTLNTLLTGAGHLDLGRVAYHPPLESELQDLTNIILVVADNSEVLMGSTELQNKKMATVTRNADLVMIARQFVWMEMFTQRIYSRLGAELLVHLEPEDRHIFESMDLWKDI